MADAKLLNLAPVLVFLIVLDTSSMVFNVFSFFALSFCSALWAGFFVYLLCS